MNAFYRLAYRLGFTPWERSGVPDELVALIEGGEALPVGRALDLGCGAGEHGVFLATHGWAVTGVDFVERAIERAGRRADDAGVSVRWVQADVTQLADAGIGGEYTLLYDHGCFHGLTDAQRERYARETTAVAAEGATFLLMAFVPGRRGPAPAGASPRELAERFGDAWELVSSMPASGPPPHGPLRNAAPTWHRLRKRASDHADAPPPVHSALSGVT